MELSRRGMLAGVGVAGGVGAVGFVGAATLTDDGPPEVAGDGDDDVGGSDDDGGGEVAVPVDPDAPFEARLVAADDGGDDGGNGAGPDDPFLFDSSDLDHVQLDGEDDGTDEHLVYVSLSTDGRETFRERLEATGATNDPASFAVSVTLADEVVRRVDLDEPTVAALTDEDWNGVLELPFDVAATAEDVAGSLAAE